MKTEQRSRIGLKLSTIIWSLAVISLFAAPYSAKAATMVPAGQTLDIGTGKTVDQYVDTLMVYGTVNLYSGAQVGWIYVAAGSTLNIYGGDVSGFILVFGGGGVADPVVTVYGTGFAVNGAPCDPTPTEFETPWGQLAVLTGTYCGGGDIDLGFYAYTPIYLDTLGPNVVIDVKPGDDNNVINLNSKGVVPVAILTTALFDAGTVEPETVQFAEASPVHWALEDVDNDGDKDMILQFKTQDLKLASVQMMSVSTTGSATKKATLTGKTADGYEVSGSDSVRIVSGKK